MIETPLVVPAAQTLFGILTQPDERPVHRIAVLILNAGVLHHVGPNRIHVLLARRLAEAGIPSFRFDLAGQGDSDNRSDGADYDTGATSDVRAVMDRLARDEGYERYVLTGICSGADHSVRILATEERVIGAVAIEFLTFLSQRYEIARQLRGLSSSGSWSRMFRGRVELGKKLKALVRAVVPEPPVSADTTVWRMPPREDVLRWLRSAERRDARICLFYSRDEPGYHQYRSWLQKAIAEAAPRVVETRLARGTDHLFTPVSSQEWLTRGIVEVVSAWTGSRG